MQWRQLGGLSMAAALVLCAGGASAQQLSQDWTWCVNRDKSYSPDQAVKGCTNVIQSGRESRKNLAIAFNNRGAAQYGARRYDRAVADFTEAIHLDPAYAQAYQGRATAYSDSGDHDRAIADFNESIRLNANNPIAFNNRCYELLLLRQTQAAIQDCDESLRQRPNHANTLMHRGMALLALRQYAKAIDDFEGTLRQDPKDAWALYGRGFAKVKLGDTSSGNADIAAAEALEDGIPEAFEKRGIK